MTNGTATAVKIPDQQELALSSVKAHALFPGRTTLYVAEVARALGVVESQVIDLIQENMDSEGKSGLFAINIASGLGNKTPRKYWRIPVSAFDAFVAARRSDKGGGDK